MTQKQCPLCSRLSSKFKRTINRFFGKQYNCQKINSDTYYSKQRVYEFNTTAPNCSCENFTSSEHSIGPVTDQEILVRIATSPLFVDKAGKIKPNIFSHIFTVGCSVQREGLATNKELIELISKFVASKADNAWEGALIAKCSELRGIFVKSNNSRAVCIYDTAEKENPAHAEISQAQIAMSEEDITELRHDIFVAFGNGVPTLPTAYRQSAIWNSLPAGLKRPTKYK